MQEEEKHNALQQPLSAGVGCYESLELWLIDLPLTRISATWQSQTHDTDDLLVICKGGMLITTVRVLFSSQGSLL